MRWKVLLAIALLGLPFGASADPRTDVQRALERIVAAGGFRADVNGAVFGPGTPATTSRTRSATAPITRSRFMASSAGCLTSKSRSVRT